MGFTTAKAEAMKAFFAKFMAEVIFGSFHTKGLDGFAKDLEAGGLKQELILKVTGNAVTPTVSVIKNTISDAVPAISRTGAGDYLLALGATAEAAVLAADTAGKVAPSISNLGTANIPAAQITGAGKVQIKLFDAAAAATDTGVYYLRVEVVQ